MAWNPATLKPRPVSSSSAGRRSKSKRVGLSIAQGRSQALRAGFRVDPQCQAAVRWSGDLGKRAARRAAAATSENTKKRCAWALAPTRSITRPTRRIAVRRRPRLVGERGPFDGAHVRLGRYGEDLRRGDRRRCAWRCVAMVGRGLDSEQLAQRALPVHSYGKRRWWRLAAKDDEFASPRTVALCSSGRWSSWSTPSVSCQQGHGIRSRLDHRHQDSQEGVERSPTDGSERAGGAKKNRVVHDVVSLPAGEYAALLTSPTIPIRRNIGTTLPPHDPNFWGLTLWLKDPRSAALRQGDSTTATCRGRSG